MERLYKTITILSVIISLCSILLCVYLYLEGQKLEVSLSNKKARLEEAQNQNLDLKNENSLLREEVKVKVAKMEELVKDKTDLEKSASDFKKDLAGAKDKINGLQKRIKENESAFLQLQEENGQLKSENSSFEEKVKKAKIEEGGLVQDAAIEGIIKKANLDKLRPKDFVTDYKGDEEFLQNCKTPLCSKIILNNAGIGYARKGQWEEAEKAFKGALSLEPNYNPAKLNLGLVYDNLKTKKEATVYWLSVFGKTAFAAGTE